jgi:steroid 5-alpha reductase family enzyme
MTRVFFITGGAVLVYMTVWFVVALMKRRNDIVDVAWGPGFILAAVVSLVVGGIYSSRALLISLLVLAWGIRLAMHIHARNRGKEEDHRYRKWREEWGDSFYLRSFLQVFMLQGVLLVVVAVPVMFINASPSAPFSLLDLLGATVWLIGFGFEAVGDRQLLHFVSEPANRGKLMTGGLWRYTRHPNYFGEVTLWWGIWLIALSVPGSWLTVVGPLTITLLILKVSGIPMLERHYEGRPDFEEYKHRTSAFFPLPPRAGRGLS